MHVLWSQDGWNNHKRKNRSKIIEWATINLSLTELLTPVQSRWSGEIIWLTVRCLMAAFLRRMQPYLAFLITWVVVLVGVVCDWVQLPAGQLGYTRFLPADTDAQWYGGVGRATSGNKWWEAAALRNMFPGLAWAGGINTECMACLCVCAWCVCLSVSNQWTIEGKSGVNCINPMS